MNRAKYLEHRDRVQDAISDLGPDGVTYQQLMKHMPDLSYSAIQEAANYLRKRGHVRSETHNRFIHLFPN